MKKLLFAMFAIIMAVACTNVDEPIGNDANKMEEVASTPGKRLSKEEACKVARNALASFGFKTPSRSERGETAYLYRNTTVSRTSSAQDSLFYVVNFNEGGYALVATRRDDPAPICIISPDRQFEDNTAPGFEDYMTYASNIYSAWCDSVPSAKDFLANRKLPFQPESYYDRGYYLDDGHTYVVEKTTTFEFDNSLPVLWSQEYPYNIYCDQL